MGHEIGNDVLEREGNAALATGRRKEKMLCREKSGEEWDMVYTEKSEEMLYSDEEQEKMLYRMESEEMLYRDEG